MAIVFPLVCKRCFLNTHLNLRRKLFYTYGTVNYRKISSTEFSTKPTKEDSGNSNNEGLKSVATHGSGGEIQTTFTKVKETTKTISYLGAILAGLGVTGSLLYVVFKELFSSKSPNNIYSEALKRCKNDPTVQNALGVPIKGYGEETSRGRRRHVSHIKFNVNGTEHIRMKFYIEGVRKKATVHLEMVEDENGSYMYRYLFVELDDFGRHAIVLEDNRFGHVDPPKGKRIGEPEFLNELEEIKIS